MSTVTCTINAEIDEAWKKFRLNNSACSAMILKCDREALEVRIDKQLIDTTFSDIAEELPESAPRYVIISYKFKHDDGRVSYPLCLVNYCPSSTNAVFNMMYSSSKPQIVTKYSIMRTFDLRDAEDFDEKWLIAQIKQSKGF